MKSNKKGSIALTSLLALAGAGAVVDAAEAASFMKLGDIKGESAVMKGEIELISWQWGAASADAGRKGTVGCIEALNFVKQFDSASGPMIEAVVSQEILSGAFLTVINEGIGETILEMEIRSPQLATYNVSYDDFGNPVESFTLRFSEANGTTYGASANSTFLVSGESCKPN